MLRLLALLVAFVGPAYAQNAGAPAAVPPSTPAPHYLDVYVAYALFAVIVVCLLGALWIWRSAKTKAKGEKDTGEPATSDKELEAL